MAPFRFGVNFRGSDGTEDWLHHCRTAERQGFDAVLAPDHLGAAAPFAMLAAAGAVTERLRLGTYVINNGFWNPSMLAREAATVDRLSGGRLELGMGVGFVKAEHDESGLPWYPHAERVARLEQTLDELDRLFADDGQQPVPIQRPRPPIMIAGQGERLLTLAARRADIVAFAGVVQRKGATLGTLELVALDDVKRKVDLVEREAGARTGDLVYSALVQNVTITDDRHGTAAVLAETFGGTLDAKEIIETPFVLVGSVEEIAREILENRDRYGFTYLVTHGPFRDALAEVIPRVRELAGES